MVIFFVALLLFCFSISNSPTRIIVAISSVVLVTLVGWSVWLAWETTENDEIWQSSMSAFRRTFRDLSERVKGVYLNPFSPRRVSEPVPEQNNQDNNIVLTGAFRRTFRDLSERVNGINPFPSRRVPDHVLEQDNQDNNIAMIDQQGEVGV